MRLIYSLFFLFGLFSDSFVRASDPVLDLDFYNPDEVKLTLNVEGDYKVETFEPVGTSFSNVSVMGSPLFSGQTVKVTKVQAYSVKGLCQLVKVFFDPPTTPYAVFERWTTRFFLVQRPQFDTDLGLFRLGTYKNYLSFGLDINNKNNPRSLYSVKEDLVDGVVTHVFTPTLSDTKIHKLLFDGKIVFESPTESLTKVTASQKNGSFVLVSLDTLKGTLTGKKFFSMVNNNWNEVDVYKYNEVLRTLHPDAVENLTLDVNSPEESKYKVDKDYDRGLTTVTYTPQSKYHVVKVSAGGQELWSSTFDRATEVVSVLLQDEVVSVRVTTKDLYGASVHVNFKKVSDKFVRLSDKEFSDHLADLQQQAGESRTEPEHPTPHVLDLSNPSRDFNVQLSSEQLVKYRRLTPKEGVLVSKVMNGTSELWVAPKDTTLEYLKVFLNKEGAPALYQLYAVGPNNEPVVDSKYDLGNNLWWVFHHSQLNTFLKDLRDAPTLSHAVELDFKPGFDLQHTKMDEYSTLGVGTTSYTAEDQHYFSRVSWNGLSLFVKNDQPKFSPVNATLYKNPQGDFRLVELGGFNDDGEWHTEYFRWDGSRFTPQTRAKFLVNFDTLKKSSVLSGAGVLGQEPSMESDEETPSEPETLPETGPEPATFVYNLDTSDFDNKYVSYVGGAENGYYFDSYVPRDGILFGDVKGPNNFLYTHGGGRYVLMAKFYIVHQKFLGAVLKTVGSLYRTQEVTFYYTYEDDKWSYSTNKTHFVNVLASELRYSKEKKEEYEKYLKTEEEYNKVMEKLRTKEEKAKKKEEDKARKEREKEEDAERVKDKLSKKTQLYSEMVKMEEEKPPELPEVPEHTPEELEQMEQPYGEEKFTVESELLYYDFKAPKDNKLVHTKDFQSNGLPALDATPVAGKFFHILSFNGRRLWVSTSTRRCTNLQLFYDEGELMGAVLRVTVSRKGKLKTGEDFDYLFVTEGELKVVDVGDFNKLANVRFQRAALTQLSRA
ncbi:P104 protein [Theileria parva strain Muguga]|uniref:Uncharacterized protein n=1 Tax=Theileria parva TaxID=5875 RepID=Q4N733_THEPA|nr:P104 protein [Theileria parva strain Muguga]EAN34225.1 P104 protein [Theileria parva strain Muguga]|eukprot:XP_766508.1 hypothetical protein [Theileria parva strain Muguga]